MGNETDSEEAGGSDRTFSRRTLIKGGAIVGGTLWVAPVVESFTSKAWGASAAHYCCSCWNPVSPGTDPNQGEADGHPPTLNDCVTYCKTGEYQNYAWSQPRSTPLSYLADVPNPGCYQGTLPNLTPLQGCDTGTITYPSGVATPLSGTACVH